ncbi:unnamed protein product [Victoria cruziana]
MQKKKMPPSIIAHVEKVRSVVPTVVAAAQASTVC